MTRKTFVPFCLLLLISMINCKKNQESPITGAQNISKLLSFEKKDHKIHIKTANFSHQLPIKDQAYSQVMVLSSGLLGYFTELGLENNIVGVSSPEYIYSEKILANIQNKSCQVVGQEASLNVEKILALKPEIIFSNFQANFQNQYKILKNNGIEVIFLDEFLEEDALQKSDYILLIGELMGKSQQAKALSKKIKTHYNALKKLAQSDQNQPKVLYGSMYGNQWFLPTGHSFAGRFLQDAHSSYPWINTAGKKLQASFEEVLVKSKNTQYWVNVYMSSRKELLQINPAYQHLDVFKYGKIYGIHAKTKEKANDYFQSANVRVDLVLQDYVKIFHPQLLPKDSLVYMKALD